MSQLIPDLANAGTWLVMQQAGNANINGTTIDLQPYKGPVTFVRAVSQITSGLGAAHLNSALIQDSADNTTFTNVTGGTFSPVTNAANASNCGIEVKTFDARALRRYVMCPIQVSGTNANIPLSIHAIAQRERV